ncbi:hypothetical protein CPAST_c13690 [Clostridium pasteurianum DSM 525 = ATCC 6013]|uniref:Uncharacterized protein n=1 Tax=Clostridium pasteurianum DSM 525 = ATCC 6013 TaxID=1262449 RepID=A0A0H3J6B6_CLOPA|nr:hypothetical protein [Clostridium pasteurianum]AJA47448.1 hypothetical protein CPAST_c13690 [Clostridium pasteurianum DSM 525 = ATCC 6013]AJA51436.1 hypothetical protein CLPA_c13690 [Clostridium pasteurianum DSM 525 = ATCC 6013]AOZ74774.1 hypothetical protein AQ983_06610 [Clostridium pasteurianum DSM 525 = ATCC 6013]AOZ78570.1 hypothetical protein AQ984_06600 [Clostridium pasteurianum]ELP58783.1 hypothetical protein F502_13418 [Clostridium pasteurianum DSM 525 = ATCC 6013]
MINKQDIKIAIIASGSKISKEDLIKKVNSLDENTKHMIYLKLKDMLTEKIYKLINELSLIPKEVSRIASNLKIDSAVIYYVYMEKLNNNKSHK